MKTRQALMWIFDRGNSIEFTPWTALQVRADILAAYAQSKGHLIETNRLDIEVIGFQCLYCYETLALKLTVTLYSNHLICQECVRVSPKTPKP